MITGIVHTAVTVEDMDKSIRFYTKALGFEKAFEIPNQEDGSPWIVYLAIGKGQFMELFYGGTELDAPYRRERVGFNHLCFGVDDIEEAARRIIQAGYVMDAMPKMGSDSNWQAWVTDPNGIRIELMKISEESPQAQYGS